MKASKGVTVNCKTLESRKRLGVFDVRKERKQSRQVEIWDGLMGFAGLNSD